MGQKQISRPAEPDDADAAAQPGAAAVRRTRKFYERQAAIVRTATDLINRVGVQGMTLAEVASTLGLVPTGVNYYFASKEELAARCFHEALAVYEQLITEASAGQTRQERIRLLFKGFLDFSQAVLKGERPAIAAFGDVRGLADPGVNAAFVKMFVRFRALLEPGDAPPERRRRCTVLAHMIISQLYWCAVWLPRYDPEDRDRAIDRMIDILENGLAARGSVWRWFPEGAGEPAVASSPDMRELLLRAATKLINEQGYQGASAEKISQALKVTKGAFYHHIDAKDDLIVACFRRTAEIVRSAQLRAERMDIDGWSRLIDTSTALVAHQVIGDLPLLRTSALNSGPPAMKAEMIDLFDRASLKFGSMVCDGIGDGSLRPIDVQIAAQMLTAMINAAAELDLWAADITPEGAAELYVRPFFEGFMATFA